MPTPFTPYPSRKLTLGRVKEVASLLYSKPTGADYKNPDLCNLCRWTSLRQAAKRLCLYSREFHSLELDAIFKINVQSNQRKQRLPGLYIIELVEAEHKQGMQ